MKIPHVISKNNVCNNKETKCFHLKSYNKMNIYNDKKNSEKEKLRNIKKYKDSCNNRDGIIEKCCSKKMNSQAASIIRKKKIYGKVEYNKDTDLESIKLCKYNTKDKCKDYKLLSPYEVCKIPEKYVNLDDVKITDFTKDCYNVQCNPQEKLVDITGNIVENYTYDLDKKIHLSIKNKNLKNIKVLVERDKKILDRVLTHSAEGNTIYHEALINMADKILIYLFKKIDRDMVNNLNIKGDSILHLALNNNNPTIIKYCLQLGSNINLLNNDKETPLYNAIKSGRYNNVLTCINNNANIYIKNKDNETPFIVSCKNNNRNISIVRLLVDNGASIDDKTKDGETIIQYLLKKENVKIVDEEIRTFLQNKKIKQLKLDKKKLTVEESKKLKDILYVRTDTDKYKNYEDFNLEIEFNNKLEYPDDLHYNKDLKENYMKPHNIKDMNYSHEPYYQKYKNLQKDRLKKLKQTIKLSEWDNNNTKDKKIEIIDKIMEGKINFDSYKYEVLNQNGLKEEQIHLLDNIDDSSLFGSSLSENIVSVKAKNNTNNNKNNPELYNITNNKFKVNPPAIVYNNNTNIIENIIEQELTLWDKIMDFINNILTNTNILITIGIILTLVIIILIIILTKQNKTFLRIVKNYG